VKAKQYKDYRLNSWGCNRTRTEAVAITTTTTITITLQPILGRNGKYGSNQNFTKYGLFVIY
jgi:hypothetical protein